MNIKKYSWMAVLPLFLSACQEDALVGNDIQQQGIYTLSGKMSAGSSLSRAQIDLSNTDGSKETAFWNEGDAIGIFQKKNGTISENVFTISSDYKEATAEDKGTAIFTTETPAVADKYVAVYPAGKTFEGNSMPLSFDTFVTFSAAMPNTAVWEEYFKRNMYMMATGTFDDAENASVEFHHLCALVRITYTNKLGKAQSISTLKLGGEQVLCNQITCDLVEGEYYAKNLTPEMFLHTNNLVVADGESTDLYMLFFPSEFGEGNFKVAITDGQDVEKSVLMPISTIAAANPDATGFEAGKRYWFKITESEEGLSWSKDYKEPVIAEVSDLEGFKEAMKDETITRIALQNPISIDCELGNPNHKTIYPDSTFTWMVDGVEQNALITVNGYEFMNLSNFTIQGDANESDSEKYLLKNATGNVFYSNINFEAKGIMDAVRVENSIFHLCDKSSINIENEEGYAFSVLSNNDTRSDVYVHNGTVNGNFIFDNNYYDEYNQNRLTIEAGTVVGNLEIIGDYAAFLSVSVWGEATVKGTGWSPETIELDKTDFTQALTNCYPVQVWNDNGRILITKLFAETCTLLQMESRNLISVEGIEVFENLEELNLNDNSIESLDLSGLSKLTTLRCNGNMLQSLNVPSTITHLECERNQLKTLDLSLVSGSFSELKCGNQKDAEGKDVDMFLVPNESLLNTWTEKWKEVNENVYLEGEEPEVKITIQNQTLAIAVAERLGLDLTEEGYLVITEQMANELEELDVRWRGITSLEGVEYFKNLKKLYCSGNDLTELNINGLTLLETLHCDDNKLTELDITSCVNEEMDLQCGNQKDERVLTLKINSSLKNYWFSSLKDRYENQRVVLAPSDDVYIPSLPKHEWE